MPTHAWLRLPNNLEPGRDCSKLRATTSIMLSRKRTYKRSTWLENPSNPRSQHKHPTSAYCRTFRQVNDGLKYLTANTSLISLFSKPNRSTKRNQMLRLSLTNQLSTARNWKTNTLWSKWAIQNPIQGIPKSLLNGPNSFPSVCQSYKKNGKLQKRHWWQWGGGSPCGDEYPLYHQKIQ